MRGLTIDIIDKYGDSLEIEEGAKTLLDVLVLTSRCGRSMTVKGKYFKEVKRVLLQDWDPIGIKDEPCAQDEYDSYVPVVCDMLQAKVPVDEIAEYLYLVEVRCMYPVKRTNHVDVKIKVYTSVIARKLADIVVQDGSLQGLTIDYSSADSLKLTPLDDTFNLTVKEGDGSEVQQATVFLSNTDAKKVHKWIGKWLEQSE